MVGGPKSSHIEGTKIGKIIKQRGRFVRDGHLNQHESVWARIRNGRSHDHQPWRDPAQGLQSTSSRELERRKMMQLWDQQQQLGRVYELERDPMEVEPDEVRQDECCEETKVDQSTEGSTRTLLASRVVARQ